MNRSERSTAPEASPSVGGSAHPEPRPAPRVPDYDLFQRIGGGSYGEVWLARNIMGTYRAVKVVYRHTFDDDRPFEREFAGIKRFEPVSRLHESQVDILHVGRDGDCFYYVMELADDQASGQEIDPGRYAPKTLRSELAREGKLPLPDCLKIALSLTTALEHLHQHGLVHRDIKPSNIIFINGAPKLADIGLVTGVEATRSYVGTEGYIPPEGPGTPQADLYGLGKVLYEISTGKDRQDFPEPPIISEGTSEERSFLEFQEVLLKACETDPRRRYQSAKEMGAELELLQGGKSVKRLRLLEKRLAVLTRAGLIAGALLVLVALAYLLTAHEARRAFREAQRADREAAHAKLAEQDARERLWEAYLAQAQATRWSGRAGRRFESLEAIRKAAEIRPSLELRNEAIACMALPDLRTAREWDGVPPGTTLVAFDSKYESYARADNQGNVSIRRVQDDTELVSFPGFGLPANGTIEFSPDNRLLAVTYGSGTNLRLRVWDLSRKEVVLQPGEPCRTCEFSPDSRALALAEHGGPIRIYDLASAREINSLAQGPLPYALRFHPKGNQLAVSSQDSPVVQIRDLETGTVLRSLQHPRTVLGLAWNSDGTLLAAAGGDSNVHIWNVANGKTLAMLRGHQASVVQVCFTHQGNLLASASWDGTLRLWDPLTGRLLVTKSFRGGGYEFSGDDRWLGYLADQPKLGVCEVVSAPECRLLCSQTESFRNSVMCSYSSNGQWLVSCHSDGLRLWQVASGKELAFIPERDARCAFLHPGGGSLITSGGAGLKQWPIEVQNENGAIQIGGPQILGNRSPIEEFSLARNDHLAFAQSGIFHLLDLESRRERTDFKAEVPCSFIAVSTDGHWAAGGAPEAKTARIWETQNGKVLEDLPVQTVTCLAFNPDGRWLVTGSGEDYRFWDTRSWQCLHRIPRGSGWEGPGRITFTTDSRLAAIGYSPHLVRLIDPSLGRELATLEMPDSQIISWFCFSPDGAQLAVSGRTPAIYLWDLRLLRQQLKAMNLDWDSRSDEGLPGRAQTFGR